MRRDACEHVKFLAAQYDEQARNGRWFLHHRQPGDSLELDQLVDHLAGRVSTHTSCLGGGLFVTNSAALADELSCPDVRASHFQYVADGVVQPWPPVVTLAVCRGLRRELVNSGVLASMEAGPHVDEADPWDAYPEYYQNIFDSTSGKQLDPHRVADSRSQEMTFLRELGAYEYDTLANCRATIGKRPIPVVWVKPGSRQTCRAVSLVRCGNQAPDGDGS